MNQVRIGRMVWVAPCLFLLAGCAVLDNFRAVERGQFYRSGQMDRAALAHTLERFDIKTVINLRGANPEEDWYRDEVAVCEKAGVTHHDLRWSKNRLPEPESLNHFVALCETAPRPILVHCQGGVHRTGVASACYVLLNGGSIDDARAQFGVFFNDAYIGTLLELYEGSPLPFAEWCQTDYPAIYASIAGTTSE